MRIEVELPDLDGLVIEEATISSWYVDEEDEVEKGEDLVELLVDDDTCSVPAPATGRLVEIVAKEGDVVRVGDVLAVLDVVEEAGDWP
ncbi:MAG: biotin/lipoyl-containing protein [Candidatus Brocadiales bacterium]